MASSLASPVVYTYRVQDFSGGLNVKNDPAVLADNEASELLNVTFSGKGSFEKRPSVRLLDPKTNEPITDSTIIPNIPTETDDKAHQVFILSKRNGDRYKLTFIWAEKFQPDGVGVYQNMVSVYNEQTKLTSLVEFRETFSDGSFPAKVEVTKNKWSPFIYNDTLYIINEVHGLFVLDVDENGDPTYFTKSFDFNVPACEFAIVHKNRVFYGGDPTQADRFYFSQLGKPYTIDSQPLSETGDVLVDEAGGVFDIQSNDLPITGFGVFLNSLVIFKRNSAYALTGSNPDKDFEMKTINVANGCVSHRTIQKGNNYLYYLTDSGLQYLYSPQQESIQIESLSVSIDPELEQVDYASSHAVFFKNCYYLFTDKGTFVFDETLKSWTKWDVVMNCAVAENAKERLIMCKEDSYHLYTFVPGIYADLYDYNIETSIRAYYATRYFDLETPELRKRIKYLKLFYKPADGNGEFTLTQEINYRDSSRVVDASYTSLVWGEFDWGVSWGAPAALTTKKVVLGGQGEYIRYKFYNDKLGQNLKIYGFVIGFKRKKKVR